MTSTYFLGTYVYSSLLYCSLKYKDIVGNILFSYDLGKIKKNYLSTFLLFPQTYISFERDSKISNKDLSHFKIASLLILSSG